MGLVYLPARRKDARESHVMSILSPRLPATAEKIQAQSALPTPSIRWPDVAAQSWEQVSGLIRRRRNPVCGLLCCRLPVRIWPAKPIHPDGGIGRRAGFKSQCRKACEFESRSGYHYARVVKLVVTLDLKPGAERRMSSSLILRTNSRRTEVIIT
jgi:hypothetical protein